MSLLKETKVATGVSFCIRNEERNVFGNTLQKSALIWEVKTLANR